MRLGRPNAQTRLPPPPSHAPPLGFCNVNLPTSLCHHIFVYRLGSSTTPLPRLPTHPNSPPYVRTHPLSSTSHLAAISLPQNTPNNNPPDPSPPHTTIHHSLPLHSPPSASPSRRHPSTTSPLHSSHPLPSLPLLSLPSLPLPPSTLDGPYQTPHRLLSAERRAEREDVVESSGGGGGDSPRLGWRYR